MDNLECKFCHTKFSLWKKYQRHEHGVYDVEKNPLNLCVICGEIYCTRKLLKGHLNLIRKDFSCPVCGKKVYNQTCFGEKHEAVILYTQEENSLSMLIDKCCWPQRKLVSWYGKGT